MSARSRRRRPDDQGVSEVIGYILGFFMAFLILISTLYAFGQVNETARKFSAQAEARDVSNRVALAVQEAFSVASARNDTQATIVSDKIRFNRTLIIPDQVQGWDYSISLDPNFVNGSVPSAGVAVSVPTFNAAVALPPTPALCTSNHVVCDLRGSVQGSQGRIDISYQYNRTAAPVLNEIVLG